MSNWNPATILYDKDGNAVDISGDRALVVREIPGSWNDLGTSYNRRRPLYEFAKFNGIHLEVDGSTTPVEVKLEKDPTKFKMITEVKFIIESTGLSIARPSESGRFGSAGLLPNGIRMCIEQDGVKQDIFPQYLCMLSDFLIYMDDWSNVESAGANGLDLFIGKVVFREPVYIPPDSNDHFCITIQDDLTSLTRFQALFIGLFEEVEV